MAWTDQQNSPKISNFPENQSLATMNDIPDELLPLIFKHLSVQDLIRCRLVCERFMLICDEIKITELLVCSKIENIKEYWFHTNEQFNRKDAIDISTFTVLRPIFNLNVSLKRLYFEGSYSDFKLLDLNRLQQLEQLKINMEEEHITDRNVVDIGLPNVKILELPDDFSEEFEVFLNVPNLEMLKCGQLSEMQVEPLNKLIHLDTSFHAVDPLENLQYLKVNLRLYSYRNILTAYPKLTTFISNQIECDNDPETSYQQLYELLEVKRSLKRTNLKIYYQSVEISDERKIDEYEMAESLLTFQIKNFKTLCDNTMYSDTGPLDYSELMHLVKGKLPEEFHKKYFDIRTIKVTEEVENIADFLQFLKGFDYLKELQLETSFDQCFYDSLPEVAQLTSLMVHESDNPISNYSFLFKLRCLTVFETNRDFKGLFELSLALFSKLKHFRSVSFFYEKHLIRIDTELPARNFQFKRFAVSETGIKRLFDKRDLDFEQLVRLVDCSKLDRPTSINQPYKRKIIYCEED